jgi:hypothetical protein
LILAGIVSYSPRPVKSTDRMVGVVAQLVEHRVRNASDFFKIPLDIGRFWHSVACNWLHAEILALDLFNAI